MLHVSRERGRIPGFYTKGSDSEAETYYEDDFEAADEDSGTEVEDSVELERIFQRQLSYPPLPVYDSPTPFNPIDKLGTLTPMEELTEPPSTGHRSPVLQHKLLKARTENLALETVGNLPRREPVVKFREEIDGEGLLRTMEAEIRRRTREYEEERRRVIEFEENRRNFEQNDLRNNFERDEERTLGRQNYFEDRRNSLFEDHRHQTFFASETRTGIHEDNGIRTFGAERRFRSEHQLYETRDFEELERPQRRAFSPVPTDTTALSDYESEDPGKENNQLFDVEKLHSMDRVRSWQCATDGTGNPKSAAAADAEFSAALDGMITQLHGSKVNWEHRVKLADDLTSSLKNVSPSVLIKNLSQVIPLVTSIAAESHFRVSLSILNTIMVLGDRLRDCKTHLGSKILQNADLTWLVRRLCGVCGESRSTLRTEGALALSHLVKGAGPELVSEPLCAILSSSGKEAQLAAGPRVKAAALDALTFVLLTFPRDDFDLPLLAKHVCRSLWNTKRRVRQAALECLAVLAHAIGGTIAMPMFRSFIDETKLDHSTSSSGGLSMKRGPVGNSSQVANPWSAVCARVSRHLLPSPSPAGLVEYAVIVPQRAFRTPQNIDNSGLEPVLNGTGSGRHRGGSNYNSMAPDIAWILAGTGPTANTPFGSPTREWLSEPSLTHLGGKEPSVSERSSNRHEKKNKAPRSQRNQHVSEESLRYSGDRRREDWGGTDVVSSFTSTTSGSYVEAYKRRPGEDRGYKLLPNKYGGGELPSLSYPHNQFYPERRGSSEERMSRNGPFPRRPPDSIDSNDSTKTTLDSESSEEAAIRRFNEYQMGEGDFIPPKKVENYTLKADDGKRGEGLDSAGSSTTRDSGVSSLKSSKTLSSPPDRTVEEERKQMASENTVTNEGPRSGGKKPPMGSRAWQSTPNVRDSVNNEPSTKVNNNDVGRSQSGFVQRKPIVGPRSGLRNGMKTGVEPKEKPEPVQIRDFEATTASNTPEYEKDDEPIPPPPQRTIRNSLSSDSLPGPPKGDLHRHPLRSPIRHPEYSKGFNEDAIRVRNDSSKKIIGGKAVVPKRLYKGSFKESKNRPVAANTEVFPNDMKALESPRHGLGQALGQLSSSDWETNVEGFKILIRLLRHHPEYIRTDLHNININGIKHLMNLRSQVSRAACLFFKELFTNNGKFMEQDAEKIAEKLLDRSADTNKFIREDSAAALEAMVCNLSPTKVIFCLDCFGTKHRNAVVRAMTARMTATLVRRVGPERCFTEIADRLLPMLVRFLQEGSLETRTYAKGALGELAGHPGFDSALRRNVPAETLRNVAKNISAIKNDTITQIPH